MISKLVGVKKRPGESNKQVVNDHLQTAAKTNKIKLSVKSKSSIRSVSV
jgi:hypothetical protein